ncbi:hypothetical protein [Streptomyces sp. MBT62]|uniref:hypothetical protein n=1 Tax=Streptomyces sp. MBT62 TaxID=2800410 RepID=UPI00190E34A5|nr:hypothetical protein [Streptomyces sp. MBT62]MBK3569976.1 hypothetical protein [Streptomyces sp. MBT62]
MRAQESRISVALVGHPIYYPYEVWDLGLDQLDMFTEEVIDELDVIAWADGDRNNHTVSARTGKHSWGAAGSYSEIVMQVSSNVAGGVGAVAITAAIKVVYEKLKGRAQGESWNSIPSSDQAIGLAQDRIHRHYDVDVEKLTVMRSSVDAVAQRYDLEFTHEDGRKFGATVGAIAGMPSCTRVWAEGFEPALRPIPVPPDQES